MQKKKTFNYDDTKKMLDTLRKLNESTHKSKNILEQSIGTTAPSQEQRNSLDSDISQPPVNDTQITDKVKDDILVINDVEVKLLSSDDADLKLTDEQKSTISSTIDNFRQQVSQTADLEPGFTVGVEQIRLDGYISDVDLNFVLISGNDSGLYLNADMLKVEDDVVETIDKLKKFEQQFSDGMEPLIRYRKNN